jgi:hypothetical protein
MNFNYWDIGQRSGGEVVEVTLSGNAANVRLFDSSNYGSFKAGRRSTYYGGHATTSPVRIPVPRNGHWYVVVDYGGYAGRGRASVQVLPGALPTIRQSSRPSLDRIASNVAEYNNVDGEFAAKEWDVFISHAHEDKDAIVRPLAEALRALGYESGSMNLS